jgi:hypothetical protein
LSRRALAEALVAGLGIALLVAALAAVQSWWDRHFLPIFALEPATLVAAEQALRGFIAVAGITLLVLRRPIAAILSRATVGGTLRILLAVALALVAGELILRAHPLQPHDADPFEQEPRRQADRRLGWVFVPARSVVAEETGRRVPYSFDAAGYRIAAPGAAVDVERPTLLFTGESIIAGFGLGWEETIPARVGALLGTQSANLAVFDYSNDQSYLRLEAELPRFRKPVAVVTLFMPSLFDKNLLDNRPHLTLEGLWQPPGQHWRLAALLHWLIPYRTRATVERGITQTRSSLSALVSLARARGADPLIVVPQFGPENATEKLLRRRILDEAGLPYVLVTVDRSWRLPGDMHPDPRAAEAIATAVARRLAGTLNGRAYDEGSGAPAGVEPTTYPTGVTK